MPHLSCGLVHAAKQHEEDGPFHALMAEHARRHGAAEVAQDAGVAGHAQDVGLLLGREVAQRLLPAQALYVIRPHIHRPQPGL